MQKVIFLTVIFFLLVGNAFGQILFEPGYFIDNNGNKTECLIKNQEWKNNPKTFEYRLSENSETEKGTLQLVREFSIPGEFKFVKYTVEIDATIEKFDLGQLGYDPNPIYVSKELFLRGLVEGKANLFMYDEDNLRLFFYSLENEIPEQLFYKRYKRSESRLAENNQYKQTLYLNLNCGDKTTKDEEKLQYEMKRLVSYFEDYNSCENSDSKTLVDKNLHFDFNLNIKPRVNFSSLSIRNYNSGSRSADFGGQTGFSGGIEAEFLLNFNKGIWSVFLEPAYFSLKAEKEIPFQGVSIEYSFLELPLGVRHYFFVSEKSKIFVNIAYVHYFDLDAKLEFEIPTTAEVAFISRAKFAFGGGYNFNGKVSLEYRLYLGKKDIFNSGVYGSDFKYSSLILGYTLF